MSKSSLRVNERIRVPEIRVIDENGEQMGILRTREALAIARQRNLDLVEVAPTAQPPVCRIMDYGKYRYEQTKKERDARKNQKNIEVKEVRLRPKIDDHDIETKARQAKNFLEEGHKVKMSVLFRGREMAHPDIGRDLLNQMIDLLKDTASIDQQPRLEGKNMTMLLSKATGKGSNTPERPAGGGQSNRPANNEGGNNQRANNAPRPNQQQGGNNQPPPRPAPAQPTTNNEAAPANPDSLKSAS